MGVHCLGQAGGVLRQGAHRHAGFAEQPGQTLSQQRRVVGYHYAHGNATRTVVP